MLKLIIAGIGRAAREGSLQAGGEQGCSLASDPELQSQLRQLWKEWLEAQDLSEPGLLEVPSGQPLYLRLLRAMLDRGHPGSAPHVFEEQLKWKRSMGGLASVGSQLRLGRRAPGVR